MIQFTFSGQDCLFPGHEAANLAREGKPVPANFAKANSLMNPVGPAPVRGWLLLKRSQLNALDLNALHALGLSDENGNTATVTGLVIATEPVALTPSYVSNDSDAAYLVEVADARWRVRSIPVNKQYNVRAFAYGGASAEVVYLEDSLFDGNTIWSWQAMVSDLWSLMTTQLGSSPTLPFTPDGTPEGWIFPGISAWSALCQVLERIGCAVRWKWLTGTYDIVRIGAADATNDALLLASVGRKIHDAEYLPVVRGRVPYGVRVYFHRRELQGGTEETTPRSGTQWQTSAVYSVDVAGPDIATAEPGTYHPVWDDLPALYAADGTLSNTAALATRAAERAADYFRMIEGNGGGRLYQQYTGLLLANPGSTIKGVAWRQVADRTGVPALVTEIVRHPLAMLKADEQGHWQECCEDSTAVQPPAFGPTWPVATQLLQVIEVSDGEPDEDGFYEATVEKSDGAGDFVDKEVCRLVSVDGDSPALDDGDRFLGRLVGDLEGVPLYAFKVPGGASEAEPVVSWAHLAGDYPPSDDTETTLLEIPIPGGTLNSEGDYLDMEVWFVIENTIGDQQIRIYAGEEASSTYLVYDTGSFETGDAGGFTGYALFRCKLVRANAASAAFLVDLKLDPPNIMDSSPLLLDAGLTHGVPAVGFDNIDMDDDQSVFFTVQADTSGNDPPGIIYRNWRFVQGTLP